MIITTTPTIEGCEIREYKGVIFGEVVAGVNIIKDFKASLTNFFGGRSGSYEEELIKSRYNALKELENRAQQIGANAIVGVDIDYETLGNNGSNMLVVIASGTAVVAVKKQIRFFKERNYFFTQSSNNDYVKKQ